MIVLSQRRVHARIVYSEPHQDHDHPPSMTRSRVENCSPNLTKHQIVQQANVSETTRHQKCRSLYNCRKFLPLDCLHPFWGGKFFFWNEQHLSCCITCSTELANDAGGKAIEKMLEAETSVNASLGFDEHGGPAKAGEGKNAVAYQIRLTTSYHSLEIVIELHSTPSFVPLNQY